MDRANAAVVRVRYTVLRDEITRPCLSEISMLWNWFVPVPQHFPLATYAHKYEIVYE